MPGTMWDDLIRMRDQVMSRWTALVREGIDLVGADTPAGQRMAEQAAFLEFATKELGQILGRWQEYRASEAATGTASGGVSARPGGGTRRPGSAAPGRPGPARRARR